MTDRLEPESATKKSPPANGGADCDFCPNLAFSKDEEIFFVCLKTGQRLALDWDEKTKTYAATAKTDCPYPNC